MIVVLIPDGDDAWLMDDVVLRTSSSLQCIYSYSALLLHIGMDAYGSDGSMMNESVRCPDWFNHGCSPLACPLARATKLDSLAFFGLSVLGTSSYSYRPTKSKKKGPVVGGRIRQ